METKEKLTRLREQNRISQSELAERLNVSRQAISRWEGSRTSPTVDTLKVLAKIYGVTVDWLLNDEETEFPQRKDETGGQVQKTGQKKKSRAIVMVTLILFLLLGLAAWYISGKPKQGNGEKTFGQMTTDIVEDNTTDEFDLEW